MSVEKGEKKQLVLPTGRSVHLMPMDVIEGFEIRPGFYEINGATAIPCGVNFTIHSHGSTSCELLLFHRAEDEPYAVIKFPNSYKIGNVYSMIVFGLNIAEFEYAYRVDGPYRPEKGIIFNRAKYLLDPYAKAVAGQSTWGKKQEGAYKARVVRNDFDWGARTHPSTPMQDLVIYEMHVRGFTRHASSGVEYPGTFAGLMEKISYLKDLGINAVELMPIFEFNEMQNMRECDGKMLLDYWGYNPVSFFAPNTGYTASLEFNREGLELKKLVKALHENGIEVILDVVFNHTAEGNEFGPFISFKGFDNNIYYLLTPEGKYYNFSGCGNTMNCNQPIVQQMIVECLRHWVVTYRIDGFRFDLASILGRNEDGSPMSKPPLLQSLAFDPILGDVKLIAEAWDAGGLYQVGSFPAWSRWSEWNGRYRDDLRSFLKGDLTHLASAAQRIMGSRDMYSPQSRGDNVSVNFLTCHDGFTLNDLYSYQHKHNDENGWGNTDGSDDDRSWNCGMEGETDDEEILRLRRRMIRNACTVLLCSRGTPMFLAGDEFCNTQFGNNNAYCQDNDISWLDWGLLEKNRDIHSFFKYMLRFRREHDILRKHTIDCSCGFPETSMHGAEPWSFRSNGQEKTVGIMFAGHNNGDDIVYLGINTWWEDAEIRLPPLPSHLLWRLAVNTSQEDPALCAVENLQDMARVADSMVLMARSVCVLIAK